jgi:hypothetical protein
MELTFYLTIKLTCRYGVCAEYRSISNINIVRVPLSLDFGSLICVL